MINVEINTSIERIDRTLQTNIRTLKTEAILKKISLYKDKLRTTDYQAIKFSEGELSEAEYEPTKLQRIEWRKEINLLEAELEEIKNSTSE